MNGLNVKEKAMNDRACDFLDVMWDLVREAGVVSCQMIGDAQPGLKPDDSVVTRADYAISKIAHERLAALLDTRRHLLVDEEAITKGVHDRQTEWAHAPYLWTVDPVDGTRLYANRIPLYGISVGLLKDRRPWLGMIFFPVLNELLYADGESAFYVQDPFGPNCREHRIVPVDQEISSRSLFLLSDNFFRTHDWRYQDCRFLVTACAVINLAWPSLGRACGCLDRSNLWDFGGGWPIIHQAGLSMRDMDSGRVLDRLDAEAFEQRPGSWRLKTYHIVSSEKNYDLLRSRLIPKSVSIASEDE